MFGPALVALALASGVVAWWMTAPVVRPPPPPLPSLLGADTPAAGSGRFGDPSRELLRHIIRPHINEVKWCYAQELSRQPGLAGRIDVQFSVGASEEVVASKLQSSTICSRRPTPAAARRGKPVAGGLWIGYA
jgi:hypothetical protein